MSSPLFTFAAKSSQNNCPLQKLFFYYNIDIFGAFFMFAYKSRKYNKSNVKLCKE